MLYQDNTSRPVNSPFTYLFKTKFSLEFAYRVVEDVAFAREVCGPPPGAVIEITSESVEGCETKEKAHTELPVFNWGATKNSSRF